jgi:hypothetical protein
MRKDCRDSFRMRLKVSIHGRPGQQRSQHLERRLRQEKEQGERYQEAIGAHVAQQAAHQLGIVRFAENLFFHVSSVYRAAGASLRTNRTLTGLV